MLKWTDEAGRARYYYSQAAFLAACAARDLDIDEIVAEIAALPLEVVPGETFWDPKNAEAALHQCSLALMNVWNSAGDVGLANQINEIRGRIMSWFDRDV